MSMRQVLYKYIIPRFYHIVFGINNRMQELDLSNTKCLCLAPHPDDESIGMGGTLAKYKDNFDVICLTDGSRAGSELTKEELIRKRADEFEKAMKISGVKNFKMLNLPDREMLVNSYDKQIDISDYDYIFIPNIMDQHRDHKSTSAYLKMLLKTKPHKKDLKIALYEVWSALALPNYFVDITEEKDIKLEMINIYQSQLNDFNYTKILSLNQYRGLNGSKEYSEGFMVCDKTLFLKILKACALV